MAEEVRFELTEGVNPRRFSRPVPSTTRPFLRVENGENNIGIIKVRQVSKVEIRLFDLFFNSLMKKYDF